MRVLVLSGLAVGLTFSSCSSLVGTEGPPGPPGRDGAPGPLPAVSAGGGLAGTGADDDPLRLDPVAVARADHHHDEQYARLEHAHEPADYARLVEAEGNGLASLASMSTVATDVTASEGKVRWAPAAGLSGLVLAIDKAASGRHLGISRTEVAVRVKVVNSLSANVLARIHCQAKRPSGSAMVEVSPSVELRPNQLVAGSWRTLYAICDFRPDDDEQLLLVDGFVSGVTDLAIDFVRLTPVAVEAPEQYSVSAISGTSEVSARWGSRFCALTGWVIGTNLGATTVVQPGCSVIFETGKWVLRASQNGVGAGVGCTMTCM
jgi:hypothetical protein